MDYVIIVAGGKGSRMGADTPKQFLELAGKPILMRTMLRFVKYDPSLRLIVVLPDEQIDYWKDLCDRHAFQILHTIVAGGATRFQSTRNGFTAIPADNQGLVAVHDGVRPLPSVDLLRRCFEAARKHHAVIPALPVTDTLRHVDKDGRVQTVDRSEFRLAQTPQVFETGLLRFILSQPETDALTDEAAALERMGVEVGLVEGERTNLKITVPEDLALAEVIWKTQR